MLSVSAIVFVLFAVCHASIISNTLGDNMVLQRAPASASIYGYAGPGDNISLTFNGKLYTTTSSHSDGFWNVLLAPTEAGGPYDITVKGPASSSLAHLKNVLFGDVYLCGGQSNMQFTVNSVFNASEAFKEANSFPRIRLFTVGQKSTSTKPEKQLLSIEQNWSIASNESLGEGRAAFTYFSAVCWFFGLNVAKQNPNLPIGLVSSNWGGTTVQVWSSAEAILKCVDQPKETSTLYNAMIAPFLPMKLSGFVWYQMSANVGQNDYYRCQFPAMINDWRLKFKQGNLPFMYVQQNPYTTDGPLPFPWSLPDLRLGQMEGLKLPKTGMASAVDLGDNGSPFTNIHPRSKQAVGQRLALIARALVYGKTDTVYQGPEFVSASIVSDFPEIEIVVQFLAPSIGSGLVMKSATCPVAWHFCAGFEIGLTDGSWHNATAQIYKDIALTLKANVSPSNIGSALAVKAVRYMYADWPLATLFNKEDLPAIPFYHVFSH